MPVFALRFQIISTSVRGGSELAPAMPRANAGGLRRQLQARKVLGAITVARGSPQAFCEKRMHARGSALSQLCVQSGCSYARVLDELDEMRFDARGCCRLTRCVRPGTRWSWSSYFRRMRAPARRTYAARSACARCEWWAV